MVDEVRQIEGKVLEISRLQEIFTEKVLVQVRRGFSRMAYIDGKDRHVILLNWPVHIHGMLQAKEIDLIHGHAVEASENVKDGNEKVRGVSSTVVSIICLASSSSPVSVLHAENGWGTCRMLGICARVYLN